MTANGGTRLRPGWWVNALLVAGFVGLTGALAAGWFLGLDLAVRDWCDGHRPTGLYWTARALNFLGNGTPVAFCTLVLAAVVCWRRRTYRPLLLPVFAFVLTTGLIYPIKHITDRAAPRNPAPDAVELFSGGVSYPSGHVIVAIVWYGVIVALLAAVGVRVPPVLRVVPVLVVLATTTYLSFHWLTDGAAAILLGLVIDRLLRRATPRLASPAVPADPDPLRPGRPAVPR